MHSFSTYNYTPLFNLKKSDFIDLKSNLGEFIPLGEDNLLPTQLNKLAREVPVHRAILNAKTNYVVGKGFSSNQPSLIEFIKQVNNLGQSLNEVFRRLIFDYFTHGNTYLELVTNESKDFVFMYHVDASKVRISTAGDQVLIHPDWEAFKGKKDENLSTLPLYPAMAKMSDGLFHAVYHIKDYEPEFYFYGLPAYFAGLRSIIITGLANVWNQSRLERQFSSPGLLIIPGINDDTDAALLDEEFQKYMGATAENATDIIIQYLSDPSPGTTVQTAQYLEFKKNEEGNWIDLHKQAEMSLITIHNWFRTLTPYSDDKSGFDKNRIISEYEIAMSAIIRPHQEMFLFHLKKILTDFNIPSDDLTLLNEPPIQRINPFKFVWEVRRDAGLDFDPKDPVQQQLVIQLKNTFGNADDTTKSDTSES